MLSRISPESLARSSASRPLVVMAVWLVAPGAALAQNVIGGTEDLEFDRPESWGMKFFASLFSSHEHVTS